MNYTKCILTGIIAAVLLYTSGCAYKKTDPEPLSTRHRDDWPSQQNLQTQANNAILTSMTVADIHFIPYRAELNSLGRTRLTAIATYLEQYGGDVIIDSNQSDELIRQQRLASVRKFLLSQGLNDEQLTIVTGLTHGRGQDANEASLFYQANLLSGDQSAPASASAAPAALDAAGAGE